MKVFCLCLHHIRFMACWQCMQSAIHYRPAKIFNHFFPLSISISLSKISFYWTVLILIYCSCSYLFLFLTCSFCSCFYLILSVNKPIKIDVILVEISAEIKTIDHIILLTRLVTLALQILLLSFSHDICKIALNLGRLINIVHLPVY
jgi:hypothetical protein